MNDRLLRRQEVEMIVGLGRSSIYRLMDSGTFPRSVKISRGAVRWRGNNIKAWLESRPVTGS